MFYLSACLADTAAPDVGDAPFAVLVLDLTPDGTRVRGVCSITNPDKLTLMT